ncbi:MAG: hypothetical protein WDN49_18580 [Acetobacteraceae bacterium]
MGDSDDWTPAAPCHALAEKAPGKITFVAYPGAYHEFDVPDSPVKAAVRPGDAAAWPGPCRQQPGGAGGCVAPGAGPSSRSFPDSPGSTRGAQRVRTGPASRENLTS